MPKFFEGYADRLMVPKGRRDILVFDTEVAGLGIRKFASGEASYILKYPVAGKVVNGVTVPGRTRRITLEEVHRGRLKAVRELAKEVKSRARLFGEDLIAVWAAAKAKEAIPKLGELIAPYLAARLEEGRDDRLRRLRASSMRMARSYLEVSWKPLHKFRLDEITAKQVRNELKNIASSSGLPSADRARAALSGLFVWAIHQEHVAANPTLDIKDKSKSRRSRKLSEAELVQIWQACGDDTYGHIVKLLILTGQRREEIGGLQWPEIDRDQRWIELPEERCKNHRRHLIPLSEPALAILEAMPRKEGEHVFGRHGAGPFNGWVAKKFLDKRIAAARKQAGLKPMEPWVLHDLRRALSTRLNELGMADPHVVEAILNHVSGQSSVAGIYNHASYITQKREALERWAVHVLELVTGRGKHQEVRPKGRARELA
jgi:integrase